MDGSATRKLSATYDCPPVVAKGRLIDAHPTFGLLLGRGVTGLPGRVQSVSVATGASATAVRNARSEVRQRQRRNANRQHYQQSEPGRESHRRCQKRYRGRSLRPPVKDHGSAAITPPALPQPPTMCQCTICGRQSPWIDPFPAIPRPSRLPAIPRPSRPARRSENYVFR